MGQDFVFVVIAGILIATAGLWWFRLVLSSVKRMPKPTRYGIYALIWLAYFISSVLVINNAQ